MPSIVELGQMAYIFGINAINIVKVERMAYIFGINAINCST